MSYVTGAAIRAMREKKGYTQRQLADILRVSDKAVSKWETQRGLPDISLIEPLASALSVSVAELLSGECAENHNRSANMLRGRFYVCPVCGNVIHACGEGSFSCCGITLPPLEAEECDDAHIINAEISDGEYFVSIDHEMSKQHYVSFIACVTCDRAEIVKLYPEQDASARFSIRGSGKIYALCNRHGLFTVAAPKRPRASSNRPPLFPVDKNQ